MVKPLSDTITFLSIASVLRATATPVGTPAAENHRPGIDVSAIDSIAVAVEARLNAPLVPTHVRLALPFNRNSWFSALSPPRLLLDTRRRYCIIVAGFPAYSPSVIPSIVFKPSHLKYVIDFQSEGKLPLTEFKPWHLKYVIDFQSAGKLPLTEFKPWHLKYVIDFQSLGNLPLTVFEPVQVKLVIDFQSAGKSPLIVFEPSHLNVIKLMGRVAISKASDGELVVVTQPLLGTVSLVLAENLVYVLGNTNVPVPEEQVTMNVLVAPPLITCSVRLPSAPSFTFPVARTTLSPSDAG
jgi:hypothetical protein